jgi:hypothetical protein
MRTVELVTELRVSDTLAEVRTRTKNEADRQALDVS